MNGGSFEFDDGGIYVGEWIEGQANGYGICTGPNNLGIYEGTWENGAEISGIYTWPNGTEFRGEWLDGQRHGKGKEMLGGLTYSGEWFGGHKNGSGVLRTGKNHRPCFEGTWRNGLQEGHGCEIYKEGGFYAGQWREGSRHGYGIRGWADIEELQDGSFSVKELFSSTTQMYKRSNRISGGDQMFSKIQSKSSSTDESNSDLKLHKSYVSTPASLDRQITFESVKVDPMGDNSEMDMAVNINMDLKTKPSTKRERVSVLQIVKNNFRKMETTSETSESRENEVYKGLWENDRRCGHGICFYGDGSRFVGQWKDNKRHGYGLLIDSDGEKCGGKWHNDNILIVTRQKNFKLPMIRKKIKQSVFNAVDAADKATKKMRLAVTRGMAARKIAEDADVVASIAFKDAEIARDVRSKFTIHPILQETLKRLSRENTVSSNSMDSIDNLGSAGKTLSKVRNELPSPQTSPRQKKSMFALIRKKNSAMLTSLTKQKSSVNENIDLDILHSFEEKSVSESALYSAMDTSIGAAALDPCLSQIVLMQHNDAHTRIAKAFTEKSAISDKMSSPHNNIFTPALFPLVINCNGDTEEEDDDGIDGGRSRKSSNSSFDSYQSSNSRKCRQNNGKPKSSWSSLPGLTSPLKSEKTDSEDGHSDEVMTTNHKLLHPNDDSRKFRTRKSGLVSTYLNSCASLASEDARFVQMKGKSITGDEVNYSYVALNTAVEGKDTILLYTDHPRPTFKEDLSISDKMNVNLSTGLYRTMVGGVPKFLNLTAPTGIPILDCSRESIDSGTANDETAVDSSSTSTSTSSGKSKIKYHKSVPTELNSYSHEKHLASESVSSLSTRNKKKHRTKGKIYSNISGKNSIHYSFSPSFEEEEEIAKPAISLNINSSTDLVRPPSFEEVTRKNSIKVNEEKSNTTIKKNSRENRNSVQICQRTSSVSQVVINQPKRKSSKERNNHETQTTFNDESLITPVASNDNYKKGAKNRFMNILTKRLWNSSSKEERRNSLRSASTDSGYKHSIDDNTVGFTISPEMTIGEQNCDNVSDTENESVFNTTVVSIENDKFRKLHSVHSNNTTSRENIDPNMLLSPEYRCNNGTVFDQNKTIEGSPIMPLREFQIPTFIDEKSDKRDEEMEDYVVVSEGNRHKVEGKPVITWV